jgi:hypothetical protein
MQAIISRKVFMGKAYRGTYLQESIYKYLFTVLVQLSPKKHLQRRTTGYWTPPDFDTSINIFPHHRIQILRSQKPKELALLTPSDRSIMAKV